LAQVGGSVGTVYSKSEAMELCRDRIECDYLVIGAGASGMSFVDTLLANTHSCTFVIVDKQGKIGGHWVNAYPFVKLHGPAAYYGVPSTVLKTTVLSPAELATGAEILDYYEQVKRDVFAPTGRVQWLLNCICEDGRVRNLETGEAVWVNVRKRIVDTTYANIQVPSMKTPAYSTAVGVQLVPPNALPDIDHSKYLKYVVIGGGKTSMDAVLWMLQSGIEADAVVWIRPREAWLSPRDLVTAEEYPRFVHGILKACVDAESVDAALELMESRGFAYRLDPSITPTMHKGATISLEELHVLRKITTVVAGQGRVQSIEQDQVTLARGVLEIDCKSTLYVDCSAEAFGKTLSGITIFDHQWITLQFLGGTTSTLSAAQIGVVESLDELTDMEKNELCYSLKQQPTSGEWLIMQYGRLKMLQRWDAYPQLAKWLATCRLNTFAHVSESAKADYQHSITEVGNTFMHKMESGWQGLVTHPECDNPQILD